MSEKLSTCEIRKVNCEDIHIISKIFCDVFNEPHWGESWTVEKSEERVKEVFLKPNSLCVIASYKSEVKGAALCSYNLDEKVIRLEELFIQSDARGIGLGKALINEVVTEGKLLGIKVIETGTFADADAYQFYITQGFSEIRRWESDNNIVELAYTVF